MWALTKFSYSSFGVCAPDISWSVLDLLLAKSIYEVHTISFQTFFVWVFKIVVDSWNFSILLLYILWDDWPIFMISVSNEQLQQQLEYILLKPDCRSWHFHHHHHHVVPLAQISSTLSRHFSLSFIASGRSSGLHPVSSHSCCMYNRTGRPALARPYVGVHRRTSLMSSSLLLRQCPACLVRLAWIVFVIGGMWPSSWCFVGCCRQDLFNIARNILVQLPSRFFSSRFVSVRVVHPYCSIDTTAVWKKLRFILSVRSDFHMTDSLSITVHAFVSRMSMSFSVDETLLPNYVNLSTSYREVRSSVEMWPAWLKHIYSVLCALTWRLMPVAIRSKLCSSVSACLGVFANIAMSSA